MRIVSVKQSAPLTCIYLGSCPHPSILSSCSQLKGRYKTHKHVHVHVLSLASTQCIESPIEDPIFACNCRNLDVAGYLTTYICTKLCICLLLFQLLFKHAIYFSQQYNLRSCSLPIKFELSGLMTFRSNAVERERDQLGTNASAGRVLSFVEVSYNYCNNNNNNIIIMTQLFILYVE